MSVINEISELINFNDNSYNLFLDSLSCISNNDKIRLQKNLEIIPIDKLSADNSSKLLDLLLDQCRNTNGKDLIHIIFKQWIGRVYPKIEEMQFYTSLFFDYNISLNNLKFLSGVFLDESFFSIAQDMSKYDMGDNTLLACIRLDHTYPDQSNYTYKTLVEYCFQLNNTTMKDYFMNNVKETSDYADIPSWITNTFISIPTTGEIKDIILKKKQEQININAKIKIDSDIIRNLINLIMDHIKDNTYFSIDTDLNDLKDKLSYNFDQLLINGNEDVIRDKYLELSRYQMQEDLELFRLLGPSNHGINANSNQLVLGGPRMLKGGDWDFDEDDNKVSWFRGNCDQCGLKIRKKCFALRKPVKEGGWSNCFCSFPCLKKDVTLNECTAGDPDLITRNLVDAMEEKIKKNGIQDRV